MIKRYPESLLRNQIVKERLFFALSNIFINKPEIVGDNTQRWREKQKE